jgi:Tfp pilus assembly protein PilX
MKKRADCRTSERGIALIIALLAVLVLSALAAALVLATQTQTWTSFNYRLTTQARYTAEAGIQRTMNWLMNSYTPPTNYSSYNMNAYPVQYNNAAVVLSAMSGVSSNYPNATQQSAFNTALNAVALSGVPNASFSVYATLLRMSSASGVSWLGGSGGGAVQTWQITSQGNISGSHNVQVQVVATYERTTGAPIISYGLAGDASGCGGITFTNGTMDAWNSSVGTYAATHQNSGGNIATNGNVTLSGGSTRIYGIINDSSNITVGNCPDGITNNVGGTPWNGLNQLSQALSYPTPVAPSPMTSTTNLNANSNTCWSGAPTGCTTGSGTVGIAPGSYGNITSNSNVHLTAGTYYINSLKLNGGSVTLDSVPVVINLGGNGLTSGDTLFTSNSSTTINDLGIPANLQIVSACCLSGGTQMSNPPVITMNSSSAMYAVVYAPNAYVHITGSSQFLGAAIGQTIKSDSSGGFSYDLALQNSLLQLGNFRPDNFSWSKF